MVSGPCVNASNCVTSPNFPGPYGNNERCELRPVAGVPLEVRAFSTEWSIDFLTVNGVSFSGSNPPRARSCSYDGQCTVMLDGMRPQGPILWTSDGSDTRTG